MRIAIAYDWLVTYAGAERVLEQILKIYPDADLFCIVCFIPPEKLFFVGSAKIKTSFIQKLPFAKKHFRKYLALFPLAMEQFDLSGYDLIISISHCVAKGVTVHPHQTHISLCCSPIRYAWDLKDEYLEEVKMNKGVKSFFARSILHYMRIWDVTSSNTVDHFVAISGFISKRIEKFYRRPSVIIYPPVDVDSFVVEENKEDFYLTASRQVPYKKIHLVVEAFRLMPNRNLVVIGDGPEAEKIAALAAGAQNITLMGYQPTEVLREKMQKARAFIFPAKEDFGIIVVEAQACGTPVIAFREGGAWETVRGVGIAERPTGVFFDQQTPEAIVQAIEEFEARSHEITAKYCRENAMLFDASLFRKKFAAFVDEKRTELARIELARQL